MFGIKKKEIFRIDKKAEIMANWLNYYASSNNEDEKKIKFNV